MKKIVLILLFVTLLSSCANQTVGEHEQEIDRTEVTTQLASTSPLPTVTEATDTQAQEIELLRESRFEFDVTAGEYGYLAVGWIEHMNDFLPNRLAFSDRELEAAEWIVETLLEMGFDENQVEMQTFAYDVLTSSWWGDALWSVEWFKSAGYYEGLEFLYESQNVILTIPGRSEQTIIIGAHYDGMANPGISDNASGTVLLLENAYRMQYVDHYYTLQYVFFGAEEVGLIGAFYFVDNMSQEAIDNLILMINADVIMDGPDLVYAIGYVEHASMIISSSDVLQNPLSEQIKELANQLNDQFNTELISKPHAITLPSDHLAFMQFGMPVMVFYATHPVEYPDTFIGDVFHSPNDCLDFITTYQPGRVERALSEFGRFLEAIVSSEFVE